MFVPFVWEVKVLQLCSMKVFTRSILKAFTIYYIEKLSTKIISFYIILRSFAIVSNKKLAITRIAEKGTNCFKAVLAKKKKKSLYY